MRGTSDGSMAYMRDPAYARFQPGPGTGDGSYAHGAPTIRRVPRFKRGDGKCPIDTHLVMRSPFEGRTSVSAF